MLNLCCRYTSQPQFTIAKGEAMPGLALLTLAEVLDACNKNISGQVLCKKCDRMRTAIRPV